MEPDVIRMYSSSPPPIEDGADEEDDEFGDFGTFSGVPNSISFTEFDTPTTFNQTQALTATSPPELASGRAAEACGRSASNGTHAGGGEPLQANGVPPAGRLSGSAPQRTEMKKVLCADRQATTIKPPDCNGSDVLTNGFTTSDPQESPAPLQDSVHCHMTGSFVQESDAEPAGVPEDQFANFAAFTPAEGLDQDPSGPSQDRRGLRTHLDQDQGNTTEDFIRDPDRPGEDASSCGPAEGPHGSCNTDRGSLANWSHGGSSSPQELARGRLSPDEIVRSKDQNLPSSETAPTDDKSSGTETETSTSFGRPLSTDALEELGEGSTTGSAPSPPLPTDTATAADHSQLAEDDEDFGDFGDACSFGGADFADFEQPVDPTHGRSSAPTPEAAAAEQEDDFGDFNSPEFHHGAGEVSDRQTFTRFPVSDSFGHFNSAGAGGGGGWNAFGGQQEEDGEPWAAFSTEERVAPARREEVEEEQQRGDAPAGGDDSSRMDRPPPVSLAGRVEQVFQSSFPQDAKHPTDQEVATLKSLLEPPQERPPPGAQEEVQGEEVEEEGNERRSPCNRWQHGGVWLQLQDIHEALGLRYQWGGSHCNKALLCCLGIDTRNILFTGQKKQPVIVPMYAAGLGMLEPTKEPVKPVSAVEMIASIGQAPPAAPSPPLAADCSSPPSDSAQQDTLPPIQFDWSSSGLTNPLDASGGSALLNLDFFGPVEDSGCTSSASIPGVDPELYELTTTKLDPGASGTGSRVADAFARLMSTMEKTSTSTRKPPREEEHLSEEALKVMAALPDLTFMQAKVLMFPTTLTPLGSHATPD